jgi:hypothetical protein
LFIPTFISELRGAGENVKSQYWEGFSEIRSHYCGGLLQKGYGIKATLTPPLIPCGDSATVIISVTIILKFFGTKQNIMKH